MTLKTLFISSAIIKKYGLEELDSEEKKKTVTDPVFEQLQNRAGGLVHG